VSEQPLNEFNQFVKREASDPAAIKQVRSIQAPDPYVRGYTAALRSGAWHNFFKEHKAHAIKSVSSPNVHVREVFGEWTGKVIFNDFKSMEAQIDAQTQRRMDLILAAYCPQVCLPQMLSMPYMSRIRLQADWFAVERAVMNASGQQDTSGVNWIKNYMCHVGAMSLLMSPDDPVKFAHAYHSQPWICEGDDSIFSVPQGLDLDAYREMLRTFGADVEFNVTDDWEKAKFLRNYHVTHRGQRWSFRDPLTIIQNLGTLWTPDLATTKLDSMLQRAKALSFVHTNDYIPGASEFALRILEKTRGLKHKVDRPLGEFLEQGYAAIPSIKAQGHRHIVQMAKMFEKRGEAVAQCALGTLEAAVARHHPAREQREIMLAAVCDTMDYPRPYMERVIEVARGGKDILAEQVSASPGRIRQLAENGVVQVKDLREMVQAQTNVRVTALKSFWDRWAPRAQMAITVVTTTTAVAAYLSLGGPWVIVTLGVLYTAIIASAFFAILFGVTSLMCRGVFAGIMKMLSVFFLMIFCGLLALGIYPMYLFVRQIIASRPRVRELVEFCHRWYVRLTDTASPNAAAASAVASATASAIRHNVSEMVAGRVEKAKGLLALLHR
jgi:hypothetical protein